MNGLTDIEVAIVRALADGLQSKEIASALDRSRTSIEFRIRTLFIKLEAKSRAQLVARGYEVGLLPAEATVPSTSRAISA
jgi:DNA-binding NarL/FixJ family response regulator